MFVTVYTASSAGLDERFHDAARILGTAIGEGGHTLVYGGNRRGTMGTLARAAREAGADVVGIIPRRFTEAGLAANEFVTELVEVDDMSTRKRLLEDRADAFVALPGGFGTLEEVFQTVVGRQLGFHAKPTVLVDLPWEGGGFWQPLLALFEHVDRAGMTHPGWRDSFVVVGDPAAALPALVAS